MNKETMIRLWEQWKEQAERFNAMNLDAKDRRELYEN